MTEHLRELYEGLRRNPYSKWIKTFPDEKLGLYEDLLLLEKEGLTKIHSF